MRIFIESKVSQTSISHQYLAQIYSIFVPLVSCQRKTSGEQICGEANISLWIIQINKNIDSAEPKAPYIPSHHSMTRTIDSRLRWEKWNLMWDINSILLLLCRSRSRGRDQSNSLNILTINIPLNRSRATFFCFCQFSTNFIYYLLLLFTLKVWLLVNVQLRTLKFPKGFADHQ
jgi:hypothetical protein